MTPKTFIFIGRSGSGKGTQARLLQEYLNEIDKDTSIFYLETGAEFREFLKGESFSSELSRKIYEAGDLQPSFLAIHIWAEKLMNNLKGNEHLIIDGTPRQLGEAHILESALDFYKRDEVYVVLPNVSRKWSEERLLGRGRADDSIEDIKRRLDWYDEKVVPAIEYFKSNAKFKFLDINGEQTIQEVRDEIIKKLNF
jgi:adenylate kinase